MRRRNYLNVILTVNAVLLSGILWTQIAAQPIFATEAAAQSRSTPNRQPAKDIIPNAAAQREQMIRGLAQVKTSVDSMRRMIESGSAQVTVKNIDQIQVEVRER